MIKGKTGTYPSGYDMIKASSIEKPAPDHLIRKKNVKFCLHEPVLEFKIVGSVGMIKQGLFKIGANLLL